MGITVCWDDPTKKIIRETFDLPWDWDDFLKAFEKVGELAREVDYPIAMIAEVSHIYPIPHEALTYGVRAIRTSEPNIVMGVIVTESRPVKLIMNLIAKVSAFEHVFYAPTLEEARVQVDAKMPLVIPKTRPR